jgi:hypothetical protein
MDASCENVLSRSALTDEGNGDVLPGDRANDPIELAHGTRRHHRAGDYVNLSPARIQPASIHRCDQHTPGARPAHEHVANRRHGRPCSTATPAEGFPSLALDVYLRGVQEAKASVENILCVRFGYEAVNRPG